MDSTVTELGAFGELPSHRLKLVRYGPGDFEVVAVPNRPLPWGAGMWTAYPKPEVPEGGVIEPQARSESDLERAGRRARKRVRQVGRFLKVDRLFTLNYRENVTDFAVARSHFTKFQERLGRCFPGLRYVAVAERQERGSWHWHVVVRGFLPIQTVRWAWLSALGQKNCFGKRLRLSDSQRLGELSLGNVDVRGSGRGDRWRSDKLASYISKYIAKGFSDSDRGELAGRRRYVVPLGIDIPVEVRPIWALSVLDLFTQVIQLLLSEGGSPRHWLSSSWRVLWGSVFPGDAFVPL